MILVRFGLCFLLGLGGAVSTFAEDVPQPIEPEAVSLGRPVDYAQDIAPILEANCTACHNVVIDEGELSLEEVEGMLKGGGRGPAIVPGKPEESLLLAVASHRVEPVMPPPDNDAEAKPLSPRELGLIRQWISEGAGRGQERDAAMIAWQAIPSHLRAIHSVSLSPQSRFVAVGRGNQIEIHDVALNRPLGRLVDPSLASQSNGSTPLYPNGAAHRDLVHAVAFHPEGNLVASGGYRTVKLWRRVGLGEAKPLDFTDVTTFALSPDKTVAAIAVGQEVRIVKLADASVTSTRSLPHRPTSMAFAADGQSLAAICEDNSLHAWKLGSEEGMRAIPLPNPAKSVLFAEQRLVTSHDDGIVRIWSAESQEAPEKVLPGHTGAVHIVAAVPGQPSVFVSAGEDGAIRVWDINSGSQARSISHGAPVVDIAVSPDGKTIASVGRDGAVRFWNLGDGNKLSEFVGLISRHRIAQQAAEALEWRKQLAAVSENRVKTAEAALKDREEIQKKALEAKTAAETALGEAKKAVEDAEAAAKTAVEQAAAKPEEEAAKKASEEAAKKVEEAKGKLTAAEEAVRSAERSISLADEAVKTTKAGLEERQKEKASDDETVKAAEAASTAAAMEAGQAPAGQAVAFSPDGSRVVASYADGSLQTFSATGQPLDTVPHQFGELRSLAFETEATALAVTSNGGVQRIDMTGRWEHAATLGPPQEAPADLARSTIVDRVLAVAFSPDGKRLATGGGEPSRSGEVIIWDVETRTPVRTIAEAHSDTVSSIAFSRDGLRLATAGTDKFAKIFDVESGSLLRSFEGHTDQVLGVSLKADGTELATASSDLSVKVWDLETGEQRRTIPGFGKQVTAVRYVGLTSEVCTSSGDKIVRLHRTNDGGQVRTFGGPTDFVHSIAVSDDGSTVVAGGEDGVLFIWNGKNGELRQRVEPPQPVETTAAK